MATAPRRSRRWRRWCGAACAVVGVLLIGAVAFTWHQGYRSYIVHTGSMSPTIPSGELVIDRTPTSYSVGDVIPFEHGAGPGDLVTHRITRITGRGIETKGDANPSADAWLIRPDQVHGVAVTHLPNLGYVAYFVRVPAGVGAVMTCALALVVLWGLFFPGREQRTVSRPAVACRRLRWRLPAATWDELLDPRFDPVPEPEPVSLAPLAAWLEAVPH